VVSIASHGACARARQLLEAASYIKKTIGPFSHHRRE
jgi:hypothetical protein